MMRSPINLDAPLTIGQQWRSRECPFYVELVRSFNQTILDVHCSTYHGSLALTFAMLAKDLFAHAYDNDTQQRIVSLCVSHIHVICVDSGFNTKLDTF